MQEKKNVNIPLSCLQLWEGDGFRALTDNICNSSFFWYEGFTRNIVDGRLLVEDHIPIQY